MLLSVNTPQALNGYTIDNDVRSDFEEVKKMVKNGNKDNVKSVYPNTFWAYFF